MNGTDASGGGPSDDGEPTDGEDTEEGGAGGGGDCATPPFVYGDAALGMIATQAWATRCAVAEGNAAKVTGDVGDCASPYTVEGTNANAEKLRAMRAQICGNDANGNKRPDWTEKDGSEGVPGDGDPEIGPPAGKGFGVGMLDGTGFIGGGGTCPSLGVIDMGFFGTHSFDDQPWWCNLVAIMHGVVLLVGAFTAIRILMGE